MSKQTALFVLPKFLASHLRKLTAVAGLLLVALATKAARNSRQLLCW
jgi:hypothetical protein